MTRASTDITMTTEVNDTRLDGVRLQRLMTWLSPAFPVGAFSYSHGLEAAVETGMVTDRASLSDWVETIVATGAGRIDAALLRAAHEAVTENDGDALGWAVERGDASGDGGLREMQALGREGEGDFLGDGDEGRQLRYVDEFRLRYRV